MKIEKAINNNVVMTTLANGDNALIMGKGIGFNKQVGSRIEKALIEKIYILDTQDKQLKIERMMQDNSLMYLEYVMSITEYAQQHVGYELNELFQLLLLDHVSFAVQRVSQQIMFHLPMNWEMQHLYQVEYDIGVWAVEYLNAALGLELPREEASFIALHLVNASLGQQMEQTIQITECIQMMLEYIQKYFQLKYDHQSIHFIRLMTHLRFFAHRLLNSCPSPQNEATLAQYILTLYEAEHECVEKLSDILLQKYQYTVTLQDKAYLVLHIQRMRQFVLT